MSNKRRLIIFTSIVVLELNMENQFQPTTYLIGMQEDIASASSLEFLNVIIPLTDI